MQLYVIVITHLARLKRFNVVHSGDAIMVSVA